MKSTRARAANRRSSKKKKKSAAARFNHVDEDDDVEFIAVCGVCGEAPPKPKTRRQTQEDMMKWRVRVKTENPYRNYLAGESNCPVPECRTRIYTPDGGCKMITCTWSIFHHRGQFIYFCGHCGFLSPNGDIPKCPCNGKWDHEARLAELEKPIDDDDDDDEDTSASASVSRESTQSHFASDEMDSNGDSGGTDLEEHTSEDDVNEGVAKKVPTSSGVAGRRAIKQEPDVVPSTAYEEDAVSDEIVSTSKVKSAAFPVKVKSETEVSSSSTAPNDENTDEVCITLEKKVNDLGQFIEGKSDMHIDLKDQDTIYVDDDFRLNCNQLPRTSTQSGVLEAVTEAGTLVLSIDADGKSSGCVPDDPHCKPLPALALNQATTGEKTDIQLICKQIFDLWPRHKNGAMSNELKLALLKLLIPQKKDKDTRAYDFADVATFIRSEVFSDEPMMLHKSPYKDGKFMAIHSRLQYLTKQYRDSPNGKGLSVSSLSDQLQKRQSPLQSSQTSEPKPKRAKRKSTCFVLNCKTISGECGLCIEHFKTKDNYICSYGDCSFPIFDWKNARCQNHIGIPNIKTIDGQFKGGIMH